MSQMRSDHKSEISKIRTKLKATKFFLTKTNNDVVKPLMQELKVNEEIK